MWEKLDPMITPDLQTISGYVGSPLWAEFLSRMESKHQCLPEPSYSRCSILKGWNLKYKKGSRPYAPFIRWRVTFLFYWS